MQMRGRRFYIASFGALNYERHASQIASVANARQSKPPDRNSTQTSA
jgi:hypothetical protein